MSGTYLIVGYGRAGKRHAKNITELGYKHIIVDPYYSDADASIYATLDAALGNNIISGAVVATPPDSHTEIARRLISLGIPTLVEKPICGLGQLDDAYRLMDLASRSGVPLGASYNYRYHPAVLQARDAYLGNATVYHYAGQYRILPSWGLLLDHLSHSIDIVDFIGSISNIDLALYRERDESGAESWYVTGRLSMDGWFSLEEAITPGKERRVETGIDGTMTFDIYPTNDMFTEMWSDWTGYAEDCSRVAHSRIAYDCRSQSLIESIYREAMRYDN